MPAREGRKENDSVAIDIELFVEFGEDAPGLKINIRILYLAVSNEKKRYRSSIPSQHLRLMKFKV